VKPHAVSGTQCSCRVTSYRLSAIGYQLLVNGF
jgi:hypothetical protein